MAAALRATTRACRTQLTRAKARRAYIRMVTARAVHLSPSPDGRRERSTALPWIGAHADTGRVVACDVFAATISLPLTVR